MVREEMMLTFKERIKKSPACLTWDFPDELGGGKGMIKEPAEILYVDLNDHEKFCIRVMASNLADMLPFRRTIMKEFRWTRYKVAKLFTQLKNMGLLEIRATFSEHTGMLCGRGYYYTGRSPQPKVPQRHQQSNQKQKKKKSDKD